MSTYWNGEQCQARKCSVIVGAVERPTWWCAGMEGTTRKAVRVDYGDQHFYLDDEDGGGWMKVTVGKGSPQWGHKSLPQDSKEVTPDLERQSAKLRGGGT